MDDAERAHQPLGSCLRINLVGHRAGEKQGFEREKALRVDSPPSARNMLCTPESANEHTTIYEVRSTDRHTYVVLWISIEVALWTSRGLDKSRRRPRCPDRLFAATGRKSAKRRAKRTSKEAMGWYTSLPRAEMERPTLSTLTELPPLVVKSAPRKYIRLHARPDVKSRGCAASLSEFDGRKRQWPGLWVARVPYEARCMPGYPCLRALIRCFLEFPRAESDAYTGCSACRWTNSKKPVCNGVGFLAGLANLDSSSA